MLDGCAVLFAQFRQSGHRGALIKVLVQCPFGTAAISLERECLMLISQLPRPPDPGGVGLTTCCSRPSVARVPQTGPPNRVRNMQPTLKTGITLTPHSPWVWHVSRAGKRLGTVSGDSVDGFTARDINSRSIGRGYVSAEAAKQAWTGPHDGRASVTYPPGASTVF